jgi:hypothetical protein
MPKPVHKIRPDHMGRNERILDRRIAGAKIAEIAEEFDLSMQRVSQILAQIERHNRTQVVLVNRQVGDGDRVVHLRGDSEVKSVQIVRGGKSVKVTFVSGVNLVVLKDHSGT